MATNTIEKINCKWTDTNDKHEYASEHDKYQGPCTGKDTKFVIGTPWKKEENEVNQIHKDVLLPPRRRHMCTSNLENLNVYSIELTGVNASHSFLGDLLLAAKYERKHIKNNLRKDILGICTDIKYRFADLGDIIRGKDM
ncbi:hypothetical protein PFDG_01975 [Plasmodium falciparum Dd2]|uniref:Duffy-antigen binding domain-containing protein n=1 Tax=Plasmodium falciparum (isolate Dd2) TaxID=57267 RepID=A0A0L7M6E9_PLAF4|nr:hypothetical protein PFDG_01975 [Plasmodium falciparum Dd2]